MPSVRFSRCPPSALQPLALRFCFPLWSTNRASRAGIPDFRGREPISAAGGGDRRGDINPPETPQNWGILEKQRGVSWTCVVLFFMGFDVCRVLLVRPPDLRSGLVAGVLWSFRAPGTYKPVGGKRDRKRDFRFRFCHEHFQGGLFFGNRLRPSWLWDDSEQLLGEGSFVGVPAVGIWDVSWAVMP